MNGSSSNPLYSLEYLNTLNDSLVFVFGITNSPSFGCHSLTSDLRTTFTPLAILPTVSVSKCSLQSITCFIILWFTHLIFSTQSPILISLSHLISLLHQYKSTYICCLASATYYLLGYTLLLFKRSEERRVGKEY